MKVQRAQGLAWRKVGDEMIVIHLANHRIFGLDRSAGHIWEALAEPTDLEALEGLVADATPEAGTVVDAVHRFLTDMAGEGLVELEGDLNPAEDNPTVVEFPRIEWREDLQQFAGQCHLVPGQSHQCNQQPGNS